MQPHGVRRRFHISQRRLRNCWTGRIDKDRHTRGCRHHFAQQLQPLRHQLSCENIDARQVVAGPGKACDKTKSDRVFSCDEDDRDRCSSRLRRERRSLTYGYDNGDPTASQIVGQSRQSITLILCRAVQDRYVLPLYKAGPLQTLPESAQKLLVLRYRGEDADHRHRPLLRARRERPRGCHARTALLTLRRSAPIISYLAVQQSSSWPRIRDTSAPVKV